MRNLLAVPCALLATVVALTAMPTSAQTLGRLEGRQASPGGYYFNAQPGEATTRLSIWGQVARPGVYELGAGFDLPDVVALAGGPGALALQERNLDLVLSVYRQGQTIYSSTVGRLAMDAESAPGIQDGDIIEITTDRSVRVNVWGTVGTPGLIVLGPEDTVRSALSMAGGPSLTRLQGNTDREVMLSVVRVNGDVAYEGLLDDLPESVNSAPLSDGDVLKVEVRERLGWERRDTLTVAGVVVSSVIALTQVLRLFESN